jgi:hypothetical protein
MPGAAAIQDLDAGSEPAKRVADRDGPNFFLEKISAPSIAGDDEPLYKKLLSNFDIVPSLKAQRLEGERRGISFETSENLSEHFEHLGKDFTRLPLICFAQAQLVVCIRRKIDLADTVPAFLRLWETESEFLTAHLNSRWLISACDTFADYGSEAQKAAAIILVVLINVVKLAETERLSLRDGTSLPDKFNAIAESHRAKSHIELWDGMTAYAPFSGDMPRNMLRRIALLTDKDAALAAIARTLVRRAVQADTLLGRFARLNSGFLPAEFR